MDIISQFAGMIFAVLALIGAWFVAIVIIDGVAPRCVAWWNDIQEGHAHYRMIRQTRAIQQEAVRIERRVGRVLKAAVERMTNAAERVATDLDEDVG